MENTLWVEESRKKKIDSVCLNPYYNGKYSMRISEEVVANPNESLNPYYNGKYSMRYSKSKKTMQECSLNPYYNGKYSMSSTFSSQWSQSNSCLNPYYNGKYSMRQFWNSKCSTFFDVLILIIMENTLWEVKIYSTENHFVIYKKVKTIYF